MKITATSAQGRLLLAMRAGRMEAAQLREAFPTLCSSTLNALSLKQLVENANGYWQLTQAGREACPNRRDTKPEPMHTGPTSKTRAHGWSSTRQQNGAIA